MFKNALEHFRLHINTNYKSDPNIIDLLHNDPFYRQFILCLKNSNSARTSLNKKISSWIENNIIDDCLASVLFVAFVDAECEEDAFNLSSQVDFSGLKDLRDTYLIKRRIHHG